MTSEQQSTRKSDTNYFTARSLFLSPYFIVNTATVAFCLGLYAYSVVRYWQLVSAYWPLCWVPLLVAYSWVVMWGNRTRLRDFRRTGLVISSVESGSPLEQSLEAGKDDVDRVLFYSLSANGLLSAILLLYVFRRL